MTPCVCGHPAFEHHAWTGHCYGTCGCSYVLLDNGVEPFHPTPETEPYRGKYANRKWAV